MKTKKIYVAYRGCGFVSFNGYIKLKLKEPLKKIDAEGKARNGEFLYQDFEEDLEQFLENLPGECWYAFFRRKRHAIKWSEENEYD